MALVEATGRIECILELCVLSRNLDPPSLGFEFGLQLTHEAVKCNTSRAGGARLRHLWSQLIPFDAAPRGERRAARARRLGSQQLEVSDEVSHFVAGDVVWDRDKVVGAQLAACGGRERAQARRMLR
eukprot:CAMPEP_0179955680 /NCGR_PEP_ID=MMETSP0983-20121128/26381_1 /TAXON_ID=483367 /ORGANISM="non described non described, Strain CCMP 2436" /LENGTH=126 /DNA_ID=CAMNT_0021867269 /DNA_START=741 /DNA_END=1121 /DNA_ORIENTATION=+